MSSIQQRNRIIYIEPNNLPGEYAAKSDGVKPDNITWAPEDLQIFVDLQVVIPSRIYRPSNANDYSSENFSQSILSGVELKKGSSFLTDDYTIMSYQEIKDNKEGSKEMLGINSINIKFDSHMYPRVTMNFTDVRGASLMMPQEQFYYDINLEKATGVKVEENAVCKNFFQSFFKFPYPRFYLSVKGVYGTCVTFVLAVEDFRATFNSDTGNFDVVVTFIGLMYGLYTDIPMNYLMIAPYIGSQDGNVNSYWREQTSPGGAFFFKENGQSGNKISTFFEFRKDYEDLVSIEENSKDFVYGENIVEIAKLEEEFGSLLKLRDLFNEIGETESIPDDSEIFEYFFDDTRTHAIFVLNKSESTFSFKTSFVRSFTNALNGYNKAYKPLPVNTQDIPGLLSHNTESAPTNLYKQIFIYGNNEYTIEPSVKAALKGKGLSDKDIYQLTNDMRNINLSSKLGKCRSVMLYSEDFLNKISKRQEEIDSSLDGLQNGASEEMKELFRESCNFTPTVENVMRMIFAHLDAFLHEFYRLIDTIKKSERILGDFNWDKDNTDILSSASKNCALPPFTMFYKNGKKREVFFPGDDFRLSSLDEVRFVNKIFDGLTGKLLKEAEDARDKSEVQQQTTSSKLEFMPIAITDYFYGSTNPYSKLTDPDTLWYFVLCRLYVGFRDFDEKKWDKIIDSEFNNLKNSGVWKKIVAKENFQTGIGNLPALVESKLVKNKIFNIQCNKNKFLNKQKFLIKTVYNVIPGDFYWFDGVNSSYSYKDKKTRESLSGNSFQIIGKDKLQSVKEFRKKTYENNADDTSKNVYYLSERVGDDKFLYEGTKQSIVFLLDKKGEPVKGNSTVTTVGGGIYGGTQTSTQEYPDADGPSIFSQSPTTIQRYDKVVYHLNSMLKGDSFSNSELWVPYIYGDNKNILIDTNSIIFSDKASDNEKALWFLRCLVETEQQNLKYDYKHDTILHLQKAIIYLIGGYIWFFNRSEEEKKTDKDHKKVISELSKKINGVSPENIIPTFLYQDEKKYYKDLFLKEFVEAKFKGEYGIYSGITKECNAKKGGNNNTEKFKWYKIYQKETSSPQNRELQNSLINLIKEDCWVFSFRNIPEFNNADYPKKLFEIDSSYLEKFANKVKEARDKERKGNETTEEVDSTDKKPINHSDKNEKLSLYLTLKNLYDRWLSTYYENNFKLKSVEQEALAKAEKINNGTFYDGNYSEFDNFLYVDSFYNDIGDKFFINPESFFNIVKSQIAGDTNYNILEFIGKICSDNKLLFRCLPVYDNLYSKETFANIFKPLSLYDGSDKSHRRIGNTYLLMYTYEPSSKLKLFQDKTNDVSYSDDSFDFADTFGITTEADNLFNMEDGDANICAFAVTPGMQNQSYFTKVSVGMDNPRVTDFSIKNKFMLAESVKGGRAEGVGEGQDMFSIYSNRSYDCNVEMLGCANIMPMMYFQLNNVPMFKGAYMITKVEHNIQNNTMTTKFTGTRMSKYYIPYNTEVFNLEQLSSIIESLVSEGTQNLSKRLSHDDVIPQPAEGAAKGEFNVWAAVTQMDQCLTISKVDSYVPLTCEKTSGNTEDRHICATAVETFLMAGFNGVFVAKSKKEADYVNNKRTVKDSEGRTYFGRNGYYMKYKLAELGFECIAQCAEDVDKLDLKAGDVCVMKHGEMGHVCMYSGKKWISDFMQNNWWVYPKSPKPQGISDVLVYRYPESKCVSKTQIFGYFNNGVWTECPDPFNPPAGILRHENAFEL